MRVLSRLAGAVVRRSCRAVQGVVSAGRRRWWLRSRGGGGRGGRLAGRGSSCIETWRAGNF